jgi:hypothetical protein
MLGMVNSFLADPVINPNDALVTGYDFLIDQADAITESLQTQGIPLANQAHLINNAWTAADFRNALFTLPVAPGLLSLNSHFEHYRFFPNGPQDVFATEIIAATDYNGSLIFSVGCHSGLNVTDALSPQPRDWPQAFNAQNASFLGNTGYGYGDSDLVAYSELLMVNFVEALGDWSGGPQTVGQAMQMAKSRYFNSLAAGSFSNYDEKVLEEMTLYGLPMLRINMPLTTSLPAGGDSVVSAATLSPETGNEIMGTPINLTFAYEQHDVLGRGSYFTLENEVETYVAGGRPIQPRSSVNVSAEGFLAKGVLWTGGTFIDAANFDPVISNVITDELYLDPEPVYALDYWFPVSLGSINRYLSIEGESLARLAVVPGQYKPEGNGNSNGTQRLYTSLDFEVYHAPFDNTDFVAPSIWDTQAWRDTNGPTVNFEALVTDDGSAIERVVVMYRPLNQHTWHLLDLAYDPATQLATGSTGIGAPFEYVVQAVDNSGNVAIALDYGGGFGSDLPEMWYINLPVILKP